MQNRLLQSKIIQTNQPRLFHKTSCLHKQKETAALLFGNELELTKYSGAILEEQILQLKSDQTAQKSTSLNQ